MVSRGNGLLPATGSRANVTEMSTEATRCISVCPQLYLYKGKGDKFEYSSSRGISLLSVVGKVYGRVLVERIRCGTESMVGEEQSGFRKGRGCVDQVFVVRQVCEKYLRKGKEVFWALMNLEKAYDRGSVVQR